MKPMRTKKYRVIYNCGWPSGCRKETLLVKAHTGTESAFLAQDKLGWMTASDKYFAIIAIEPCGGQPLDAEAYTRYTYGDEGGEN